MATPLIRPALAIFTALTIVTGVLYPVAVTTVAQAAFPAQAKGSLVVRDGRVVGSTLIGQAFSDPKHFHGRPSATAPMPYNAVASGGANQGPLNPALVDAIRDRVAALRAADPGNTAPVRVDLVTASASGLDPHISPAAARYQAARVARAHGIAQVRVDALIASHTEGGLWGSIGEPRVNVLELNLALDALSR